jgi:transposase
MDDIDQLLNALENPQAAKLKPAIAPHKPALSGSIDDLLAGLDESVKRNVRQQLSVRPPQPVTNPSTSSTSSMDSLLAEVKVEQTEKAQLELAKQQELEAAQQYQATLKLRRLEQLRAQRREALKSEAEQWLNQLKPRSEEGRWFAEFACNYESRLDAAVEYLEALQEVDNILPSSS